ncbi:MAG: hypothetical protein JSS27_00695 [Planctomycetes bacterium]|nr:hypothetical protein [Planctomycetota bacterium]
MQPDVDAFIKLASRVFTIEGTVCQLGSRREVDQDHLTPVRELFAGRTFLGIDDRQGHGVDRVEEFAALSLPSRSAATVVCLERLECIFEVQAAVAEMLRILTPGGLVFVAASMSGPSPGYPWDYWRLTPHCLCRLFESLDGLLVGWRVDRANRPLTVFAVGCRGPVPVRFAEDVETFTAKFDAWLRADEVSRRRWWQPALRRVERLMSRSDRTSADSAPVTWNFQLTGSQAWRQVILPQASRPPQIGTQLDLG